MSLRIVVDMNLSPEWVEYLQHHGFSASHWNQIGNPCASDAEIMKWARAHESIVFTHDLDFGTLLALTHESGPSVIQIRTEDLLPGRVGHKVVTALRQHDSDLNRGALVVIDEARDRVRILPF